MDTQRELFFKNHKLLDLGRQIGANICEVFGVSLADLSAPILVLWVSCPYLYFINQYFFKKLSKSQKSIWEWELNLGLNEFCHRVSVVRDWLQVYYFTWICSKHIFLAYVILWLLQTPFSTESGMYLIEMEFSEGWNISVVYWTYLNIIIYLD